MTTMADWTRSIVDAAEERGWAVIAVDARANAVTLEEPGGSNSMIVRIQGRELSAHFISQLPEAGTWNALPVRVRSMLDTTPCWCVSTEEPHVGWIHSPACLELRQKAGVA